MKTWRRAFYETPEGLPVITQIGPFDRIDENLDLLCLFEQGNSITDNIVTKFNNVAVWQRVFSS